MRSGTGRTDTPSVTTCCCKALHHATPSSSLRFRDAGGVGTLMAGMVAVAAPARALVVDIGITLMGKFARPIGEEVSLPVFPGRPQIEGMACVLGGGGEFAVPGHD